MTPQFAQGQDKKGEFLNYIGVSKDITADTNLLKSNPNYNVFMYL